MPDSDPKTVRLSRAAPPAGVPEIADIDATQTFTGGAPPYAPPPVPSQPTQYDEALAPTRILSATQGGSVRPPITPEAAPIEPPRRASTLPGTNPGAEPDLRRVGRYQILDK